MHQKIRTDFKVLSDNFEQWLKDNPNQGEEKGPQRAMINEKGNVIYWMQKQFYSTN